MTDQPTRQVHLTLPWPPSTNTYWRHTTKGVLISAAGRKYREKVTAWVREQFGVRPPRMAGRLAIVVEAFPPDRRRRDLDNLFKALLDAMQYAGVYLDDSQADRLTIARRDTSAPGRVEVVVEEWTTWEV